MNPKPPHQIECNRRLCNLERGSDKQRDAASARLPLTSESVNDRLNETKEKCEPCDYVLDDGNGDNGDDDPKHNNAKQPGKLREHKNTASENKEKEYVLDCVQNNTFWHPPIFIWIRSVKLIHILERANDT
jgi:hypothetical protein